MPFFNLDDLIIRTLEPDDADTLFQLVDANRTHLRPWMPWTDSTISVDDTQAFITRGLRQLADDEAFHLGIWSDGVLAGTIGLHNIDRLDAKAEIGYWIGAEHQGRGIITHACRALIDYGFTVMKLNRLEIHCAGSNTRSRAVAERLGFHLDGLQRQALRSYGEFMDEAVYSMLAHEWAAKAET